MPEDHRLLPTPAIKPPSGREPERVFFELDGKSFWSSTGYQTSVYIHRPPAGAQSENKKLPVLYIHGIQSHPSWFFGSAVALADAGHTVYQVTRRGSGDNTKQRGHAISAGGLYSDITVCIRKILDQEKVDKVHLLGVSWGGKLIAAYPAKKENFQKHIASISLLAPGIAPKVDVPLTTKIGVALCKLTAIFLAFSGLIATYIFRDMVELSILLGFTTILGPVIAEKLLRHLHFRIPLNDPELFTHNPAMQEYLREDKFQLHKVTAQFMYVSKVIDIQLKFAKANSLSYPTTLILANDDRIIDNEETEHRVSRLAGDNLKVVNLPGSHTLEFEPNPQPFFCEVVQAVARGEA